MTKSIGIASSVLQQPYTLLESVNPVRQRNLQLVMTFLFLAAVVINAVSFAQPHLIDSYSLAYTNMALLCLPTLLVFYGIANVPSKQEEESALHVIYFLALGALITMNALHLAYGNFSQEAIAYSTLVAAGALTCFHVVKASIWEKVIIKLSK